MQKFDEYENEKYEAGDANSNSRRIFKNNVVLALRVLLLLMIEPFIAIKNAVFGVHKMFCGKIERINGQVALVTGSANGLGRAIAFRLAQEKCKIAVADINFADAQRTASEISAEFKVEAVAFKVDVSDAESITQLKRDVESSLGPVDILVNNAGILLIASLREFTDQQLRKAIDVNLLSHFWTVRSFLDGMIERKRGRIVAIASLASKISIPLSITYSTTKSAIKTFMESLQEEMYCYRLEKCIKLSTVFPGFIATRKELTDFLDTTSELAVRLTPEEVADQIVKGILDDKRDITIPPAMSYMARLINALPERTYYHTKTRIVSLQPFKKVLGEIKEKNFMGMNNNNYVGTKFVIIDEKQNL